jgi:hypothetical protein
MNRDTSVEVDHAPVGVSTGTFASRALTVLILLTAALSVIACLVGLFNGGGTGPVLVTSLRGEDVELYGVGLYRYDTVFMAAGSRGTDIVTLALGVPILVTAFALYRRQSQRGGLVLGGALPYFLYVYASRALYNAYNEMFLVYIAVFSASLFGFILAVVGVDRARPWGSSSTGQPRRGLAGFLIACGVVTSVVWLLPLVGTIIRGEAPQLLDTYATSVTDVLDLGVIVPTTFVAAALVLRRSMLGYMLASAVIVLLVLTAATIVTSTVVQIGAGVEFTPGEIIGPISGFLILGIVGTVFLVRLLRDVGRQPRSTSTPRSRLISTHRRQ